jgi:hypothetical protein
MLSQQMADHVRDTARRIVRVTIGRDDGSRQWRRAARHVEMILWEATGALAGMVEWQFNAVLEITHLEVLEEMDLDDRLEQASEGHPDDRTPAPVARSRSKRVARF